MDVHTLRIGDIFKYDWGSAGATIVYIVDVVCASEWRHRGYMLSGRIIDDHAGLGDIKLVLGETIILKPADIQRLGSIYVLSRLVVR